MSVVCCARAGAVGAAATPTEPCWTALAEHFRFSAARAETVIAVWQRALTGLVRFHGRSAAYAQCPLQLSRDAYPSPGTRPNHASIVHAISVGPNGSFATLSWYRCGSVGGVISTRPWWHADGALVRRPAYQYRAAVWTGPAVYPGNTRPGGDADRTDFAAAVAATHRTEFIPTRLALPNLGPSHPPWLTEATLDGADALAAGRPSDWEAMVASPAIARCDRAAGRTIVRELCAIVFRQARELV